MKQRSAHLAGIGFSVIFGFTFLFSKIALTYVSPVALISYRFLFAFLVFELLRRFKVIKVRFWKGQWKLWLPIALCEPVLYFFGETFGLQRTTTGEAGLMIALIPVFVTLLSAFVLREKPLVLQVLFILLSIAGILVIQFAVPAEGQGGDVIGFLLLLGAVLTAAFFTILSRKASRILTPTETTYFMMLTAAVAFNLVYLPELAIQGRMGSFFTDLAQWEVILPLLYLGIVASIGGYFLVNFALSKLPAPVSSIYSNLSTVVAVAAGALILGEPLSAAHFIGGAMIIAGVYGTVFFERRKTPPPDLLKTE